MPTPLVVSDVAKSFTMHLRDGIRLPVVANVSFSIKAGECAVLGGPSGAGKSSILKMVYGNYAVDAGQIIVPYRDRLVDVASRRSAHNARHSTRHDRLRQPVPAHRTTCFGVGRCGRTAESRAALIATKLATRQRSLLAGLNLPERLWSLPPATFSGGEQQRVNIARGFITDHPILLLDEPTASLDAKNRDVVVSMIQQKKDSGRCHAWDLPRRRCAGGCGRSDHRCHGVFGVQRG